MNGYLRRISWEVKQILETNLKLGADANSSPRQAMFVTRYVRRNSTELICAITFNEPTSKMTSTRSQESSTAARGLFRQVPSTTHCMSLPATPHFSSVPITAKRKCHRQLTLWIKIKRGAHRYVDVKTFLGDGQVLERLNFPTLWILSLLQQARKSEKQVSCHLRFS